MEKCTWAVINSRLVVGQTPWRRSPSLARAARCPDLKLILPGKTLSTAAGNGKMYVGSDQLAAGGWANAVETITITGTGGTLSVGGNLRVGQGCTNGVNSLDRK